MGWTLPPSDVQRRVADIYGDVIWPDLRASLDRVRLQNPQIRISSWYRDPATNRAVGGVATSQHQVGLAVDLVPPRSQWQAVRTRAALEGFTVIDEGDHLHLQVLSAEAWRRSPLRRPLLRPIFSER